MKVKRKKDKTYLKKGRRTVEIRKENDIFKVSFSKPKVGPRALTEQERGMFTEEEGGEKPRVLVFQQLGDMSTPKPRRLKRNKRWRLKKKGSNKFVLKKSEDSEVLRNAKGYV